MKFTALRVFLPGILFAFACTAARPCTIFVANDGHHVWIGNNEDELQHKRYRFWYYPGSAEANGYMIWTELPKSRLLNSLAFLNPQGGLNEHGLFMDYTAIDRVDFVADPQKPNRKKELVRDILRTCTSVEEAIRFLGRFNLIRLTSAQLFIADATGDYAIVHGGYLVRKSGPSYVLTNYSVSNGSREACYRRDVVTKMLQDWGGHGFDLPDVVRMLQCSAQKSPNDLISNYSMAIDPAAQEIHLFLKGDFTTPVVISLRAELKKGRQHQNLADYFPADPEQPVALAYTKAGAEAAIAAYQQLREHQQGQFNFQNDHLLRLAARWIDAGDPNAALGLLQAMKLYDTVGANIDLWRGVALLRLGDTALADETFSKVLALDPQHYLAKLFGRQRNGRVFFDLPAFEGAETVQLMGEFTGWTKNPIAMVKENGRWKCSVSLVPGAYSYKFIVNGKQYLADDVNFLHTGSGPAIFSRIYVR